MISVLSSLLYSLGGEFAAVPGIILEGLLNVVIVEITHDTFAGFVNRWIYFNILFYAVAIYLVSLVVRFIRNERKEAGALNKPEPHQSNYSQMR
jgi:phosphate/sulfate permease